MDSLLSKPSLLGNSKGTSRAFALQRLLGAQQGLFLDFTDDSALVIDGAVPANNYRGKASSLLTFTRASTATRIGPAGLIENVASGALRIDYDPVTKAVRGLLIEGARTNLALYSQTFADANYTKTSLTVTDNAALSPDGALTAATLVPPAASSSHQLTFPITFVSGTTYTYSLYAKAFGYQWLRMAFGGSAFPASGRAASFDLSAGALGTVQAGVTATITAVGNGWYRCVITAAAAASLSDTQSITVNNGNNTSASVFTGDGTSGLLVYGTQVEAAAIPSSYIPTTSATVTRAAEVCKILTSAFPATATGPYTLFCKGIMPLNSAGDANRVIASLSTNSFAESRYISRTGANSGAVVANNVTASTGNAAAGGTALSALANLKVAARFDLNNANAAINGTLGTNDTSCAYPSAPTQLNIGNLQDAGTSQWHGWIQQIAVIPVALTDAQLQAVTA